MAGEMKVGAILHYKNFPFENGTTKNKYLVVLGAKPNSDYLCALATSQKHRRKSVTGCHLQPYAYFFVEGGGKNFFPLDTWIILSNPVTMKKNEVIKKGFDNILEVKFNLVENITGEIRNCLKRSEDISQVHKNLL